MVPNRLTGLVEASWAEDNIIVSTTRACKGACLIIIRVAISHRTPILEKLGVSCRATVPRITTIFIGPENSAWIVATTGSSELIRALSDYVGAALDATGAPIGSRIKSHGHIKSINQRYIEEVHVVELVKCEFGQGVRGCTIGLALEAATTISGLTRPVP